MNYRDICYKRNFVNQVICRLDFSKLIPEDVVFRPEVINTIMRRYPLQSKDQLIAIKEIKISNPNSNIQPNSTNHSITQKTFLTKDGSAKCVISPQVLFLDFNVYDKFQILKKDIESIINELFEERSELVVNRIGLRYINIFSSDTLKLNKSYFNSPMSNFIRIKKSINESTILSRALGRLEYIVNDELRVNYAFGQYNINYPGKLNDENYVMDFDAVYNGVISSRDKIIVNINEGHDAIQLLFEDSITDKLRMVLNG